MLALMLGGPVDGKRFEIPSDPSPNPFLLMADEKGVVTTYFRTRLVLFGAEGYVYAAEGMLARDVDARARDLLLSDLGRQVLTGRVK